MDTAQQEQQAQSAVRFYEGINGRLRPKVVAFLMMSDLYNEAMWQWGTEANATEWYRSYHEWACNHRTGRVPTAGMNPLHRAMANFASGF